MEEMFARKYQYSVAGGIDDGVAIGKRAGVSDPAEVASPLGKEIRSVRVERLVEHAAHHRPKLQADILGVRIFGDYS
jgi:hypothetical protein